MQLDESELEKIFSKVSEAFNGMMKALFRQKGATLNIDILTSDNAQKFIETHAGVLDSTFDHVKMSDTMRDRLQQSDYIFSGMKAFHELNEAFPSLLDENGERKPFEQFLNDVQTINKEYNKNYLRAEYNFVQASSEMAGKWEQIERDGDRYNLRYRTAGDERVRPAHRALEGVTLPPSDPFWDANYPPNGWNCRCTVVQVLRSRYPVTPQQEATRLAEEAMKDDKKGMFRFNSGKQRKSVPDYNPYTIKRCNDCDIAKGKANLTLALGSDICEACRLLHLRAAERNSRKPDGSDIKFKKW